MKSFSADGDPLEKYYPTGDDDSNGVVDLPSWRRQRGALMSPSAAYSENVKAIVEATKANARHDASMTGFILVDLAAEIPDRDDLELRTALALRMVRAAIALDPDVCTVRWQ